MSAPRGPRQGGLAGPLLRWVLWSRRRALGVLVLVVAVVFVAARLLATAPAPVPTTPPAAPATPTNTIPPAPAPPVEAAPAPTAVPAPPAPPAPAPPNGAACPPTAVPGPGARPTEIATGFAVRWVAHTIDPRCWLVSLQPWSTDTYGKITLPTVDPTSVPANRVIKTARVVSMQPRDVEVEVPLDQLAIRVSVIDVAGTGVWRVDDVNPYTAPTHGTSP